MTEAQSYGMVRTGGFPEDFCKEDEITNYQFRLMCKMRYKNVSLFEEKYNLYLKDLNDRLFASSQNSAFVKKVVDEIIFNAYHTIPGTFWN